MSSTSPSRRRTDRAAARWDRRRRRSPRRRGAPPREPSVRPRSAPCRIAHVHDGCDARRADRLCRLRAACSSTSATTTVAPASASAGAARAPDSPGPTRDDGNPARELQQLVERGARSVADAGHGDRVHTAWNGTDSTCNLCISVHRIARWPPPARLGSSPPARASGQSGMEKEVAVDDLGERSHDALPAGPTPDEQARAGASSSRRRPASRSRCRLPGHSRDGSAVAAPRISVATRETVRGRHAPVREGSVRQRREGRDREAAEALRGQDGAKIVHTVVPWNVEGATYATNYAGPNPFDVSYQTSTDLTGLGTKGVLEVLNTRNGSTPRRTGRPRPSSSRTPSRRACTRASSTACRASSAARSSTTTRTCSRRPA